MKNQYAPALSPDKAIAANEEKMSIIAEALSEVVKEYMDKKNPPEEEEDY